ncbi:MULTISPECIES: hypothetical protein [unclassified Paenibacillus]
MKINKTIVTIGTTILLISSVVPAALALNAASKESTGFVKPTISSLKDLDHVEVLKSLNNAQTVNLSVYGVSDSQLDKQTEYLKTLNGNELFETLGELSIYDEPNFERYAEAILPYLNKQWQGKVPTGVSDILADQEYNSKLRAFIIDILANGNKLDRNSLEKMKTVIEKR